MTITEFLLARIAEDEELARDAAGWDREGRERSPGRWARTGIASIEGSDRQSIIYSDAGQVDGTVADYVAHMDPARVLAECEAKRRIVERHAEDMSNPLYRSQWEVFGDREVLVETDDPIPGPCATCHRDTFPCPTLRDLASVYADHPDFREKWRA